MSSGHLPQVRILPIVLVCEVTMTIRKIAEPSPVRLNPRPCNHPTHGIPTMQVFGAGTYENTCDGCGHKTVFTIASPNWQMASIPTKDFSIKPCGCGKPEGCYGCMHH